MEQDCLYLVTPEGVTLDLRLAGIGSRATAAIVDFIIQTLAMLVAYWILPPIATIVAGFCIFFGYHLLFETLAGGQTPGKRMLRLRVVRTDAGPVTFVPSLTRTLLRIVDGLPVAYGVGMVAVFASSRNQRLGDMAAGTVVMQEPELRPEKRGEAPLSPWGYPGQRQVDLSGWDVTDVSEDEVAVIRRFLTRRHSMDYAARRQLASRLAIRLDDKVHRPPGGIDAERFLVGVLKVKEQRGG
jgi:uncharacterized RDD family membrane protein YckC